MKLLLDTHLVLWIAGRSDKLSETAKNLVLDSGNLCCFSAVSFWEIMIKLGLNRSDFQVDVTVCGKCCCSMAMTNFLFLLPTPWN